MAIHSYIQLFFSKGKNRHRYNTTNLKETLTHLLYNLSLKRKFRNSDSMSFQCSGELQEKKLLACTCKITNMPLSPTSLELLATDFLMFEVFFSQQKECIYKEMTIFMTFF